MDTEAIQFFDDAFFALTGYRPYPWQRRLFLDMIAGCWPEVVSLPTGCGKTSVLHVWLLALAWSLRAGSNGVPRRLAWVVDRRVVVDQVTKEAEDLAGEGLKRCPELRRLLAQASSSGTPLALSTLRGQKADSGDWTADPAVDISAIN